MIDGWGISCEIALMWMSMYLTDHKSALVQVMAWFRQATSHYLNQCWPDLCHHMVSLGYCELIDKWKTSMLNQLAGVLFTQINFDDSMHYNVWDEITYPFPTSMVQPIKFGNRWVISSHTLLGICNITSVADLGSHQSEKWMPSSRW